MDTQKHPRPPYDLVVMAASFGGVHALCEVLGDLPADFPAPIAIVQHRSAELPNMLAKVLGRSTPLAVKNAEEGETMLPGTVYLAPPDHHLQVQSGGIFHFMDGHRIHYLRSSANPLFDSAADVFDGRLIAVVLTGSADDATDGVQSVKARGGVVIAQDEESSAAFGMPGSAIATGCVDRVLPLKEIGPALRRLVEAGAH
jgi:two-component system, chemotaxis family, protein-glutamate methylesterase/glutaminase